MVIETRPPGAPVVPLFASSDGTSVNATTTYTTKTSISLAPGTWDITWSAEGYCTGTANEIYVRVQNTTATVTIAEVQKPNSGAFAPMNADFRPIAGIARVTTTGTETVAIQFRNNGAGDATIRRARIRARRVS